jgi:uncharacterized membrane protein required for colicin V production
MAMSERDVHLDNLAFNLVDLLLIAILGVGIVQGRRRGMSGELVGMLKWLALLFGCAAIYRPLGRLFAHASIFTLVSSCLVAYLGAALLILFGFAWVEHHLGKRLAGSDLFGRGEYYLGMAAGAVRVACMLLVALALLNARTFSPTEVKLMDACQDAAFGCHYFPTLHSVQSAVFEKSLVGPWIKQDLGFLLIQQPESQQLAQKK